MVFPAVMCRCESWTIRKAEHQRIDTFELWSCRRLLRIPWTSRRSNKSVLWKSSLNWKDCCWSWSSNTLATWCEELTHKKRPWFRDRLRAEEEDDRGQDGWMTSLAQWRWVWAGSGSWWRSGTPGVLQSMGSQRVGHDWVSEEEQQHAIGQWSDFTILHVTVLCSPHHLLKRLLSPLYMLAKLSEDRWQ